MMHAITLQGQRYTHKLLNIKHIKILVGNYFWQRASISKQEKLNKCLEVKFIRVLYLALGPILSRNVDKIEESMCTVQDHVD
jgi:hypothetical protein